jgi:hypothetical protein
MIASSRLGVLISFIIAAAAGALGCGGGTDAPPTNPGRTLASISVALPSSVLQVGQTATATASGLDQTDAPIAVGAVTWVGGDALAACRLSSSFGGVGLGFPRGANRLRTVGDVRATVLFTDFSDAVATRTPQSAFGLISPAAENYYKAVSYGKMNLISLGGARIG